MFAFENRISSACPAINLHETDELLYKWFELIAAVLRALFKAIKEHGWL